MAFGYKKIAEQTMTFVVDNNTTNGRSTINLPRSRARVETTRFIVTNPRNGSNS